MKGLLLTWVQVPLHQKDKTTTIKDHLEEVFLSSITTLC